MFQLRNGSWLFRLSSRVSGGRMPGRRRAIMDFPLPGGPIQCGVLASLPLPGTLYAFLSFHVAKSGRLFLVRGQISPDVRMTGRSSSAVEEADHLTDVVSSGVLSMPSTTAASQALPAGKDQSFQPLAACGQRNGRAPRTGCKLSRRTRALPVHIRCGSRSVPDSAGCSQMPAASGRSWAVAPCGYQRSHIDHRPGRRETGDRLPGES